MGQQTPSYHFRSTPELLRELRTLRVAVFHPRDSDGDQLIRQLLRMGCNVQAYWPPSPELPDLFEVAFLAVRPETIDADLPWTRNNSVATIIAVVNYENPTIVDAVMKLGSSAVIASPIRSSGVLSTLILARQISGQHRAMCRRIDKLEIKVASARKVSEAKAILMRTRNISEDSAYALMRDQAMAKRVGIEEIATAIVNASEILKIADR
jgi:AmiR/NasT family two-component response regulator